ncbi:MAG TPA: hypothetical protein VFA89_18990 [Terriglobales bacterium]|nr:hypothetical protein [Terriglobales bacterium]
MKSLKAQRSNHANLWVSVVVLIALVLPAVAQVAVTTQHNDNNRSGQNLNETVLNTSNVNVSSFGRLFARHVDGQIYAQPLYVPNLVIGKVKRNVVYVVTEANNVYAFDADDANAFSPLWSVNLGTPVPYTDIASYCVDIHPQIGITGTPVIDTVTNTIYVVAKSKDVNTNTFRFMLHALDLISGREKSGSPVTIAGRVKGTGYDSHNGYVQFRPLYHNNRPGLLLLNGVVYVGFGSTCDTQPWHGWVFGYDAATLAQTNIFNATPNGYSGGIWGAGTGLAADADNIYIMTGNGTFDATAPVPTDYGDSVVKINVSSGLKAVDYFTPFDQSFLNHNDVDLGSGAPMIIPGTSFIVGIGKDASLRLMDSNNLGQYHGSYNGDLQEFLATTPPFFAPFMGTPIYWNSPNFGPVIYIWGSGDYLKAYQFSNGLFNETPITQSTTAGVIGYSNSVPLSLSANNSQTGTGIVWAAGPYSGDANQKTVKGIVRAFDATNLGVELWNSQQNATRDAVGLYAKFCPPTVANGKVYVATFSGQLVVYGLLGK